jgi:hypothetical protein
MRTVGTKLVGLVDESARRRAGVRELRTDKSSPRCERLVEGLEQKVDAQQEQLEHQGGLLQDAQKVVRVSSRSREHALSGMSEFWQAIDVNMSVASSYAYNFRNPARVSSRSPVRGRTRSDSGLFYPFHRDHNSFQVDQVWFDIGKESTDESRAGFHRLDPLRHDGPTFLGSLGASVRPARTRRATTTCTRRT